MCRATNSLHNDITIRHFEPKDIDQVKALFLSGMLPLVWEAYKVSSRAILNKVYWQYQAILVAPIVAMAWQQGWDLLPAMFGVGAWIVEFCMLHLASAVLSRRDVRGYVNHSLTSDLSDIPSTYQTGNGGCFLVALDTNKQIVGMVGGEFKKQQDNGGKTYELRRISVDPSTRGKGLGKRLIQQLEKELAQMSTLFLTCTSIQYAAHALYQGQGFQLIKEQPLSVFKLMHFEKHYSTNK